MSHELIMLPRLTILILISLVISMGAEAQNVALPNHDPDAPVEISADELTVSRDNRSAVFAGNVDVVQGQLVMRAAKLNVFYRENAGGRPAVELIEAEGNVVVSSPSETARGKLARFEVDQELITLTGDVVLTRGQNVLKGNTLVLNLRSGESTLQGDRALSEGATPGERVRAIFSPSGR